MRIAFATLLLVLAPHLARGDAAADAAAGRRGEAAFGSLSSLRAEFRQSVIDARGNTVESAEGTMSLARPGRFRWDYREPAQLIVSDGVTVWFHDIDSNRSDPAAAERSKAHRPCC